jgi:hypothetical protein
MLKPAIRNLKIEQNTDWSESFTLKIDDVAVNLSGYSLRGECRTGEDITSDLVFAFTFGIDETLVTVSVDADTTEAIETDEQPDEIQFFYDYLLIAPDGSITKIQKGRVTLCRTVTE